MFQPQDFPIPLPSWLCEVYSHSKSAGEVTIQGVQPWYKGKSGIRVVLEGLPGAGKTTLGNSLSGKNTSLLSQFEGIVHSDESEQNQYINNDLYKDKLAQQSLSQFVVMDRDFTSTLAYSYAKSQLNGSEEYAILLEYYKALMGTEIRLGDIYVYLKLDPQLSIFRKKELKRHSIWEDEQFLNVMVEFYEEYFEYLSKIVPVIFVDTRKMNMQQVFDRVTESIEVLDE